MRKRVSHRPAPDQHQTISDARHLVSLGAHVDITVAVRLTPEQGLRVKSRACARRVLLGDIAQALGMQPAALSRRLGGRVPLTAAELVIIAELLLVPLAELISPDRTQLAAAA